MSQSHIEAFSKAQFNALTAKDNKERLRFTIAGCKDGHLYDHSGNDYGLYNADAPDTVFISDGDLELSRITGTKIASITLKATKFFEKYGSNVARANAIPEDEEVEDEEVEDEEVEDDASEEEVEDETPAEKPSKKEKKKDKKSKSEPESEEIDVEAVEKSAKKAIKKGDFKKAQKLINKLGGHKKLQKKLDEAING